MKRWTRVMLTVAAAALMAGGGGCASVIGSFMVDAPNAGRTAASLGEPGRGVLGFHGVDRQFRVEVGPPEASLLVWVIDPLDVWDEGLGEGAGASGWLGRDEARVGEAGRRRGDGRDSCDVKGLGAESEPVSERRGTQRREISPRGTLLVLHTYRSEMLWMLPKAHALARRGFRCVLVDLRGHGHSTGEFLSFGVQESVDLSQVIDELERRGEMAGKLGVWGMSYGASVAVMLGARDERVRAVVAVAPFASMGEIVPHYATTLAPGLKLFVSDEELLAIMNERAAKAGFDPKDADMVAAATNLKAPLLLMHGAWDWMVPPEQSEMIAESSRRSGCVVEHVTLPCTGHLSMYFDMAGRVERESAAWFGRWLIDGEEGR